MYLLHVWEKRNLFDVRATKKLSYETISKGTLKDWYLEMGHWRAIIIVISLATRSM